ncbi:hypothetical protein INT46_000330 [Mucor plumbeus]|uniref:Uncharacterized protein n=1 Tax=Mucor plumbeus TaxID=97098 RepID=A0A8H7V9T3_9FUNG|nr:hypothetical protein INT46_000330 [Mucor plumbeus]
MALVFASKNKAQLSRRRMVEKIVERDDVNVEKRLAGHGMREVTVQITTLTTALPLPQSQPGAAPIDIATPLQQDFALLYKIPTHSTLLLSYPDNGPEE